MDLAQLVLAIILSSTGKKREKAKPGVTSAIPSSANENRDCVCCCLKSLNLDSRSTSPTFHISSWFSNTNAATILKSKTQASMSLNYKKKFNSANFRHVPFSPVFCSSFEGTTWHTVGLRDLDGSFWWTKVGDWERLGGGVFRSKEVVHISRLV